MRCNSIQFQVPSEWQAVISDLVQVLSETPDYSAKQYVTNHASEIVTINELIDLRILRRNHVTDEFSIHIVGLLFSDCESSKAWMRDIENVFGCIKQHYAKNPIHPISLKALGKQLELNTARYLETMDYLYDLALFDIDDASISLNKNIHPREIMLTIDNVTSYLQRYAEVMLPVSESKMNEKAKRTYRLIKFLTKVDTRTAQRGLRWDSKSIVVQKEHFWKIFFEVNYDLKECALDTLIDIAKDLGAKFKPGTNHATDAPLRELFEEELRASNR